MLRPRTNLLIKFPHFHIAKVGCCEFGENLKVFVRFPGGLVAESHLLTNGDGESIPSRRLIHAQEVQEKRLRLPIFSEFHVKSGEECIGGKMSKMGQMVL